MVGWFRSSRGSALTLTLLTVTFAIVVLTGFLRSSGSEKRHAAYEYQGMQAYYVAETGLTTTLNSPNYFAALLPTSTGSFVTLPSGGNTVQEVDGSGSVVRDVGTYEIVITKLPQANMFLFESRGSTGHAEAMASAEVHILRNPYFPEDAVAVFGSSVDVGWTVPGNAGDGFGNQNPIWYLFENGNVYIHGPLTITGTQDNIDIYNGSFFSTDETAQFVEDYPWLDGKHVHWSDPPPFPNPADMIRDALESQIPPGPWTSLNATQGFKVIMFAEDAKGEYTGKLNPNASITGGGVLGLNKTDNGEIVIDDLNLTGDLILLLNKDCWINEINQLDIEGKPQGHRLIVITDHKLRLGKSSNTNWCPFPHQAASYDQIYLGAGSILWSKREIVVMGDLRPLEGQGDTNPHGTIEEIRDWGPIALICRDEDSKLSFHQFKAPGLIYSAGVIEAYFLRLHGTAMIREPLRGLDNPILGMANCHITYDPNVLEDLGLFSVVATSKLRRH